MKPLTNIFKQKRLELGLTISEVAKKANLSYVSVSRLENGNKNLSLKSLITLCDFYKIPYEEGVKYLKN